MIGYVKRINDSTLRVPIGGVRIGSAKYSRLAQINLHTHIITFSKYAIENVPERGRRYLVIHELAHVKEPSHNKHFWGLVAEHEPNYKQVGKELDRAFHENVKADLRRAKGQSGLPSQGKLFPNSLSDDNYFDNLRGIENDTAEDELDDAELEEVRNIYLPPSYRHPSGILTGGSQEVPILEIADMGMKYPLDSGVKDAEEFFDCNDGDFDSWQQFEQGIVFGGSEDDKSGILNEHYFDHL